MRFYNNFCSYLFFAILIFNALALLSSEFSHAFSQVFMLLSHDGRIFNLFSLIMVVTCVCVVCVNMLNFSKKINENILGSISLSFILTLCVMLLIIFVFLFFHLWDEFFNVDLTQDSIKEYSFKEYFISFNFFLMLICAIFLCICPLIYNILSLYLSVENAYARVFLIFKPDLNTAIFTLSALACHPFFSSIVSKYVSLTLLFIGVILLLRLLMLNIKAFRFYEYANTIFLSLIILCFIACSESLLRSNFYNAQNTLFTLAILSWCKQWLTNLQELKNNL